MTRNIILDLGGVLIDVDYHETTRAFRALGLDQIDDLYNKQEQQTLFDDMNTGRISNEEFRNVLLTHLPAGTTGDQVDIAWNAMLGKIPPHRIRLLERLKPQYRLFLLSNTNRIHIPKFMQIVQADYGRDVLDAYFEKIYFSCDIGMRKPDREIFDLVLGENKLNAQETVFIDDSPQHVEGAKTTGLSSHYLDLENDTLEELLDRILTSGYR